MKDTRKYTVIGIWGDDPDCGRFAEAYEADSPEAAETMALESSENCDGDLIVAGVVAQDVTVVL